MLQLQVNIYYQRNNKDQIYSGVYKDPSRMISDFEQQQRNLLSINQGQRFYFDNAYAKIFAIEEQFVEFPQDKNDLFNFLEFVFYLSIEKKHPVIAIFLTSIMTQSVFQGIEYWKDSGKNIDKNKSKGIKNTEIQNNPNTVKSKITQILGNDYSQTQIIYAIKKIARSMNDQKNVSKVAILTNFTIQKMVIYSLKSDVSKNKYDVSPAQYIKQIQRPKQNIQINYLERYENVFELENQYQKDEQYILVFNDQIPAFQFPLDLRNR